MNSKIIFLMAVVSSCFFTACEETLPPRNDPSNFFTTSLKTLYVYNTPKENSLYLFIVVKNNYDETLEAKATIEGTLRIQWKPPADYLIKFISEKNVTLSVKDIYTGVNKYDVARGTLRLDPGDSLVLGFKWDFMTDDKTDLLLAFNYSIDKDCYVRNNSGNAEFRKISEKQLFEITANVKVFTQTAILYAQPLHVNQCFVSHDRGVYDPQFHPCVPIDPYNPCSILQSR